MLARQHDAAIDGAEIGVVLGAVLFRPAAGTAKRPRHAVPGDADAALIFLHILRMDLGALRQCGLDLVGGGQCFKLVGRRTVREDVAAQKHAAALAVIIVGRIADVGNRLVGIGDAAIDAVILFPEAALKLQAHLIGSVIGQRVDGVLHRRADIHGDLAQDGGGNGADAPFGRGFLWRAAGLGVDIADGDAVAILLDVGDLAIVFDRAGQLLAEGLADHAHATHRLEQRRLEFIDLARDHREPHARVEQLLHRDGIGIDRQGR